MEQSSTLTAPPVNNNPVPLSAQLKSMWFGSVRNVSMLTLESDQPLAYVLDTASSPERLALILLGDVDSHALRDFLRERIPPDHPHIRAASVRQGKYGTHLELAFALPMSVEAFRLLPQQGQEHRLVLDMSPAKYLSKLTPGHPFDLEPDSRQARAEQVPVPVIAEENRTAPAGFREEQPNRRQADGETERDEAAPLAPYPENPLPSLRQEMEQVWLDVTLNNQPGNEVVLALHEADGTLLLSQEDLQRWRLLPPPEVAHPHEGQNYFPLAQLGIRYQLDLQDLTLNLEAPVALFQQTLLDGSMGRTSMATPSSPGAFLNYDLSTSHADGSSTTSGFFELGLFNRWGSGTASFVTGGGSPGSPALVRLNTYWQRDDPRSMRTLRVGDSINRGTAWSGAVRFGGLQWGTNFSTQPELVTLPMLNFSGEASLPSVVDLYVNDALRLRNEVPPGPFSIRNVPAVSGAGETRLVIRDMLGREQVISASYFASPRLLREGLSEYSQELGFMREGYGQEDSGYGALMGSSTYRLGISDSLTAEAHGQLLREQQTIGLGGFWQMPWNNLLNSSFAVSRAKGARGHLLALGIQRQGKRASVGLDTQFVSEDFVRLGSSVGDSSLPARQIRASAQLVTGPGNSLSLAYTRQEFRLREDLEFVTAGYGLGLGTLGFLNLSAMHFLDSGDTSFSLHFTLPLGMEGKTASLAALHNGSGSQAQLLLQRSLPAGQGLGYRLQADLEGNGLRHGSLAYQNDFGLWQIQAAETGDSAGLRADAKGGLALVGGSLSAGRSISESFALVSLPGFADVRVYVDNQEVGRTDRHGKALVPRLRSYENNRIRIEQADLPLDVRVNDLEVLVRPYFRSGVAVAFDVTQSRDAFFRILLDDGQPMPLGAVVQLENGEQFPVGLRGEAYLIGVEPSNKIRVLWRGQTCFFILEVPEREEPLLDLGSFTCKGVTP